MIFVSSFTFPTTGLRLEGDKEGRFFYSPRVELGPDIFLSSSAVNFSSLAAGSCLL